MMTNKEAVNWIINLMADIGKAEHSELWHYEQALKEIKEMLEPEFCWTPVSEMLPEKNGRYLVTNSAGEIVDVDWNVWVNGEWLFPNSAPIAWMPLPEPWKGEE